MFMACLTGRGERTQTHLTVRYTRYTYDVSYREGRVYTTAHVCAIGGSSEDGVSGCEGELPLHTPCEVPIQYYTVCIPRRWGGGGAVYMHPCKIRHMCRCAAFTVCWYGCFSHCRYRHQHRHRHQCDVGAAGGRRRRHAGLSSPLLHRYVVHTRWWILVHLTGRAPP